MLRCVALRVSERPRTRAVPLLGGGGCPPYDGHQHPTTWSGPLRGGTGKGKGCPLPWKLVAWLHCGWAGCGRGAAVSSPWDREEASGFTWCTRGGGAGSSSVGLAGEGRPPPPRPAMEEGVACADTAAVAAGAAPTAGWVRLTTEPPSTSAALYVKGAFPLSCW